MLLRRRLPPTSNKVCYPAINTMPLDLPKPPVNLDVRFEDHMTTSPIEESVGMILYADSMKEVAAVARPLALFAVLP